MGVDVLARSAPVPPVLRTLFVASLLSMSVVGGPGAASAATPGSEMWAKRFDGSGRDSRDPAMVVSPDGSTVFVTGGSFGASSGPHYGTVAYDTATGAKLWVKRYNGAGDYDRATAIEVSPDGSAVFVTGRSVGSREREPWNPDYATVAYAASTGSQLWVSRYNGPANGSDSAGALGVSPNGSAVFVTGASEGSTGSSDYATVAYDAASGSQLWARRYDGSAKSLDSASALGVSPDGSAVFVTGRSEGSVTEGDYATVAYEASTGSQVWVKRYDGPADGFDGDDRATAVSLSPDGSAVFVTGRSLGSTGQVDFATLAYDATSGSPLWVKRHTGSGTDPVLAPDLAVSPDGSAVFVTGTSAGSTSRDFATIAYNASTGARLWAKRYDGPANLADVATALGVSPDGSTVFVTGYSFRSTGRDYATVAYDASAGDRLWAKRYDGPLEDAEDYDVPTALEVSPDGTSVFVTGSSQGLTSRAYATVAYNAA